MITLPNAEQIAYVQKKLETFVMKEQNEQTTNGILKDRHNAS